MEKKRKQVLILVSHTHWDPEWYSTYQEYRVRLVKLVDKLLHILERNRGYRHFMFDGQVSAIEDYLDIRPENEERIRRLVRQGKLLIGPWWILPEEFMISPESHIRNLLLGYAVGKRLGGVMNVSYLCDMPGHISQMPQILRGFGIAANAAWRGIKGYPNTRQSLFRWKAPDGSEVLMINMVKGYGNLWDLASTADPLGRIHSVAGELASCTPSKYLLLLNGDDHGEPSGKIPAIIRKFNRSEKDMTLVHGTLPQYVSLVRNENRKFKEHAGELFSVSAGSYIFASGNLATRMGIKTALRAAEQLLEQWAEPFGALAWTLGGPDQRALLWRSWRYLLQNNFHDVIYGGHVDRVTIDAMNRFKASREISNWITQESIYDITRRIDTRGVVAAFVVFNPIARKNSASAEFEFFDNDFNAPEKEGKQIAFLDETGALIPCQVHGREQTTRFTTDKGVIEKNEAIPSMRYDVSLHAADVPGLGYRAFTAAYLPPAEIRRRLPKTDLTIRPRNCENRFLKIRINRNGTIDLTDKVTGNLYRRLNYFEDSGDYGDHYFFGPPMKNRILTTLPAKARVRLCRKGPVEAEYVIDLPFKVPADSTRYARNRRMITCHIATHVSLKTEAKRVDIRTVIENRARNHRIRAVFPSGINSSSAHADGVFDVIKRPNTLARRAPWFEKQGYYPQRLFMSLNHGPRGFTLINRGLPQYQVDRKGSVYLTLLRCVSHLAKRWMPGWESPAVRAEKWPTPGAQEIGVHCFHYAIYPHAGDWQKAESHKEAMAFNASLKAVQTGEHPGKLPRWMGFVEVSPSALILSAVKSAQKGKGIILRLCNISGRTVDGSVKLFCGFRKVSEVNLNEEKADASFLIRQEKSQLFLRVPPHKIVTLKLVF